MIGKYVDYLIRFENTGTYAAENVVVKDIIDTKRFDVSTLQNHRCSHEVYTRIEGNKVEFIFENIQLPFDDANNDGYIVSRSRRYLHSNLEIHSKIWRISTLIITSRSAPMKHRRRSHCHHLHKIGYLISTFIQILSPTSCFSKLSDTWTKAEIFDVAGRIMRAASLSSLYIDVSTLESGTYFVRLRNGEVLQWC